MIGQNVINVVIPFGFSKEQPEREQILHFVVKECIRKQTYPEIRIVLAESGTDKTQERFAQQFCDEYHFLDLKDEDFSIGALQNRGYELSASSEFTYIHQADFLLPLDGIEKAHKKLLMTGAPFVFPFYSAISLSHPITNSVLDKTTDWKLIYKELTLDNIEFRTDPKRYTVSDKFRRLSLSPEQIDRLDSILPFYVRSDALQHIPFSEIWGDEETSFSYFRSESLRGIEGTTLVDFRIGVKASASYLARSADYAEIGGAPEMKGWGYEDLGFWERVKTFYDYLIKEERLLFRGFPLTGSYPLVHLWHSTAERPNYYSQVDENKQAYENFVSMTKQQRIRSIKPLEKR